MNKNTLILAASILSLSAVSFANTANTFNSSNNHPGQFYVSALAGIGKMSTGKIHSDEIPPNATSLSQSMGGFAWQASAGYLFASNSAFQFGLETGLFMPANSKYSYTKASMRSPEKINVKISQYGVDLLGVAKYHLGQSVDLFTKAGETLVIQKAAGSISIGNQSESDSTSKITVLPTVAVGADFNLTKNLSLNLTGRYTFGTNNIVKKEDLKVASSGAILAGITYNIG